MSGKLWEHAGLVIILSLLQTVIDGDSNDAGKVCPSALYNLLSVFSAFLPPTGCVLRNF